MGTKSLAEDMGISFSTVLRTEAAAALGVASRRGIGKIRHISTRELWMQNAIRNQEKECIRSTETTTLRKYSRRT